jgi:hypothetical protein
LIPLFGRFLQDGEKLKVARPMLTKKSRLLLIADDSPNGFPIWIEDPLSCSS